MSNSTYLTTFATPVVPEGTTCLLTATLKDETGAVVPGSGLTELKIWLYATKKPTVFLNGRNGESIKNTNGGSVDADGVLTLTLDPADNALTTQGVDKEQHEVMIEYTYNGGSKVGRVIWRYLVANLPVPT